ncbi:MAG: outer membrane beta-barrel protein [Chitinispirillaceae bacterium]|nr:outer membrane beta-barrel protein [Chitinispirillaceae bacterium]
MKARLMAGVVTVAMAVSFASAQEFTTAAAQGSWAGLFTFNGLAYLGAGDYNGGLGVKYYLANNMAIRGGLQFATYGYVNYANPPAGQTGIDGEESAMQIGINGAFEYHLATGRVSPYVGAGFGFTTTSTEELSEEVGNPPPAQDKTVNGRLGVGPYDAGTALSLGALAGLEFFVTKEISLSAEYWLGYTSLARADEEFTTGSTTTTYKIGAEGDINITTTGAITLSVYF